MSFSLTSVLLPDWISKHLWHCDFLAKKCRPIRTDKDQTMALKTEHRAFTWRLQLVSINIHTFGSYFNHTTLRSYQNLQFLWETRNKHQAGDLYIIMGHQDQERSSFTSRGDLLPLVTICILRAAAAACLAHCCSVESKTPVFVAKPQGIFFFLSLSGSSTQWRCCCPLNSSPCR